MITSPRYDHNLVRQVREIRARPGWTNPLEQVNGHRVSGLVTARKAVQA